jgi:hypothetical protein
MQECEIFLAVDAEGTYIVNADESELDFGELSGAVRIVRIVLNVPLPTTTTVKAALPDQPHGNITATVSATVVPGEGDDAEDDVILPA